MSDKMRQALRIARNALLDYGDERHIAPAVEAIDAALAEQPAQGEAVPDGMWKISKLIATLQSTHDRFGDTCVWMRECKWGAAALHAKSEAEAAPPAPAVPVGRQYYFRVSDCPAKEATDPNCICWHDSGTGPCKPAREADRDSFSVCLEWRDKPAPPAPAVPDDIAKDAARYRWLRDSKRIPGDFIDGHIVVCDESGEDVLWGSVLDRAIDAAMRAAAPEVPRG